MAKKKQIELSIEEKLQNALVPKEEQPYKIPNNWCWTYVSNVMNIVMGQSPKGVDTTQNVSDIPLIGGASDMGDLYPRVNKYTKKATKLSKEDDVILSIRATLGRPIFSDGVYCLGRGVAGISSNYLSKEFIRYYYICFESGLYSNATGTTFLQVTGSVLNKMLIPLPPIKEQQRIVNIIESLFAKLDKAKELIENTLAQWEQNKMAILHKAFTGELTAKWRKENNIDLSSWKDVIMQDICEKIVCGKTPTGYISKTGEIPYLKVYNIVDNKIDFNKTAQFIPNKIHKEKLKSSILKPNDIIMNIVGPPLRKIAIIPDNYPEWNMNQAIVRFRVKKDVMYKFIYYILIYPKTLDNIINKTKGVVGQANISITQSRNIQIKLPTVEEQQEIVNILDRLLAKYNKIKNLEQQLEKIELLKKAILTKAFRGELGTNNPDEESAENLLKEILAEK